MAVDTWNGSVCVVVTVGTRPGPPGSGATRAAIPRPARRRDASPHRRGPRPGGPEYLRACGNSRYRWGSPLLLINLDRHYRLLARDLAACDPGCGGACGG